MKIHFYPFLNIIEQGMVSTYGDLASFFGLNNHSRFIGRLLNQNKNPEKYPCFLVVQSDGKIGGFALGEQEKIKRLNKIGIEIENNKIKDFTKKRWQANFYNYFLALPLFSENLKKFQNLQKNLKQILPAGIVNWQNPDSAHITLNFLGKISLVELGNLVAKLRKMSFGSGKLEFSGADFFSLPANWRVGFLNCKKGADFLEKLSKKVFRNDEGQFLPHITVFRVKDAKKFTKYEEKVRKIMDNFSLSFSADFVRLYTACGEKKQIPLIDFDGEEKISVAEAK